MNNVILFETAEKMALELNSLYKNNKVGKRNLLGFMDANNWFGFKSKDGGTPYITDKIIEQIKDSLTLWLSAYKQPGRVKTELMLCRYNEKYPHLCRLYRRFINDNNLTDEPSAWKLLDFILSEIDRDISGYSEQELEKLIRRISTGATLKSARLFSDFLRSANDNGNALTKWEYTFESRECPNLINDAYPLNDFAVMAYCVFNESMRQKQNLLEKAVESKIYADLWLFSALHFICALRKGDMKRLPAPELPYGRELVFKNVLNGTFTKKEADALVDEMVIRLKLKRLKPLKTIQHKKAPDLKLFVPESLKTPLGIMIAVSLAHHPELRPGEGFVTPSINMRAIRNFFGNDFVKALGGKHFSPRRCNKSYLQGIEAISDDSPGKPKGYMLASLARSHKSGIGNLAEITEIYLKDAKFSGYTPEFIIREMFERGVFSFIPAVLLEIYDGKSYKALTVKNQTKLIGELGFSAYQTEWMVDAVECALIKSRSAVNSIIRNPHNIGEILQNIASGNAPGRQDECLCLMTAAGFSCPSPGRDSCIGCGYEIYTKTAMHTLMNEYVRLTELKKTADKSDVWRYGKILEQAVLPAISEILGAVKLYYNEADITEILNIVERGIEYADGSL